MSGGWTRSGFDWWRRAAGDSHYDIYHTDAYVAISATYEHGSVASFGFESDAGRVFLPLLLRPIAGSRELWGDDYFDASSPYGYPGPLLVVNDGYSRHELLADALGELKGALREHRVVSCFMRGHPILSGPGESFRDVGTVINHGRTVSMDLRFSQDDSWRALRSNHRRDIRKAANSGVQVGIDHDWVNLDIFVDTYHRTMMRHQAAESYYFPRAYFLDLVDQLGESLVLCVAKLDDTVVGASLYSVTNGIVQYMLSGTDDDAVRLHPLKSMLYFMRGWARDRGERLLHLGGGLGGREDALFEFKQGFADCYHDFWSLRAIVDEERYATLISRWEYEHSRSADPVSGYFPGYRNPLRAG